jgi:2-polyprenyl-6-methoxyphenol hydroxylase-like FAD-dependent oxidoreductase
VNGRSGEALSSISIKSLYQFPRRKLRALLAEDLDIQFHKKLRGIEYSEDGKWTTSLFEDGVSIVSRLVVGADGAHSMVRQLLLGQDQSKLRRLPYCATFVQAQFPPRKAQFLRSFYSSYLAGVHPSNKYGFFGMQDGTDPKRPETWTFFFYISWPSPVQEQNQTANWSNIQRLRQVKEMARDFSDPWKSAFSWLPDEHDVWHTCFTDFDLAAEKHRWSNHDGRVTLAGDAAHAMTTQRGQGLNHSMTDAANLCKTIKQVMAGTVALDTAIKSYELEMVARTGEEVRVSALNTEMLHNWNMALCSPMLMSGLEANTMHVPV